ncbi:MAG: type IV secretory system conjugative DNA transfer family protein [Pseudomonadota bacterium]
MRFAAWIAIALLVALTALSAPSQFIAAVFHHQPALGRPLFVLDRWSYYPPWSVWEWSARWGRIFPKPFAIAQLIMLAGASVALLVGIAVAPNRISLKPFGKDAWGDFSAVREAGLFAESGAILGKFKGEILCFDGPEHQLLVGASRSGKGRGHVVPTLLAWPHSALVLDVKGELDTGDPRHGFPGTSGFRAQLGPVLRFAPTRSHSNAFNPLFEVRRGANEVRDVQNIVEIIVDPAGDGRHHDFWDRSAKQILVGLILHVLYAEPLSRKHLAVVREKLADLDRSADEMRTTLHRLNAATGAPEVHPEILHAALSYLSGEERLRSGVKATSESFFGLFADPIVADRTATSDFRIGDLMCSSRPVTVFLQPPPSDTARLMPLMRLMLNQIARALMEDQTHDAEGRTKTHALLLMLDEFPQLGRMPFFETAMGAMAGYGLKAYLVCQSLNHISRAYGRDNVLIDNCGVVTAFAAADMDTAKRIADMAGEAWEIRPHESEHRPRALLGPRKGAITYREERRPLLLPGEVRALARDEELVFVSGMKPLRAKKLRFDTEAIFAQRLRPPAQATNALSRAHDWSNVVALGRLPKEKKPIAARPAPAPTLKAAPSPAAAQPDLFASPAKISDLALSGFRDSNGAPLPHPDAEQAEARRARRTGV